MLKIPTLHSYKNQDCVYIVFQNNKSEKVSLKLETAKTIGFLKRLILFTNIPVIEISKECNNVS